MPSHSSFGSIQWDVTTGKSPARSTPHNEIPFRIAVLGDFSGRASRGIVETGRDLARRSPLLIDRDNFDEVMEKLEAEIHLPVAGSVRFRELDEFHPDQLQSRLPMFSNLKQVANELSLSPSRTEPEIEQTPAPAPQPNMSLDGLLDQAVEETSGMTEKRPARTKDDFQSWLDEKVAPHLEPKTEPRQAQIQSLMETAITAQMRALMHFPTFQAIESAWRGLFFLVRRVQTSATLKLYLIDVSKNELAADLNSTEDISSTGTYRLLNESSTGAPWSILVGHYSFGTSSQDLRLLARLGVVGSALGSPWFAQGDPLLVGCKSMIRTPDPDDWIREPNPGWQALRKLPVASSINLALPRFLLRLPYGADTDPCEQFAFEEMGNAHEHERYLWGNPAVCCACMLADSFASDGWNMHPGDHLVLDRLPLYIYKQDGESHALPCAEILMTERAAGRILERGLMPLASLKGTDSVRLLRFQSISEPA